jgi:hypothetical protein
LCELCGNAALVVPEILLLLLLLLLCRSLHPPPPPELLLHKARAPVLRACRKNESSADMTSTHAILLLRARRNCIDVASACMRMPSWHGMACHTLAAGTQGLIMLVYLTGLCNHTKSPLDWHLQHARGVFLLVTRGA